MSDPFAEPRKIAALMTDFDLRWGFCGGWAIDLFLDGQTREHKDVDIALLRRDQLAIQRYLRERGWSLEKATGEGGLVHWEDGEWIDLPIHVIWCRNPAHDPDFLELLFNEDDGTDLLFRRDPSIRLPLADAFEPTVSGLAILAPQIALLYKARRPSESGNGADFAGALPALDAARRQWLSAALEHLHPDHPWLQEL